MKDVTQSVVAPNLNSVPTLNTENVNPDTVNPVTVNPMTVNPVTVNPMTVNNVVNNELEITIIPGSMPLGDQPAYSCLKMVRGFYRQMFTRKQEFRWISLPNQSKSKQMTQFILRMFLTKTEITRA